MTQRPVRREVVVAADRATAFALFTAHIGAWWPLGELSVHGSAGSVAFEADRLVERVGAEETVWAEVLAWDPPSAVHLAWHPGHPSHEATEVSVTFEDVPGGTRVAIVHTGWERLADPTAARTEYEQGWPVVLGRFAARVAPVELSWYILRHTPRNPMPEGESVFGQPAFREHVAFLDRMAQRGALVAAGPLPAEDGTGMTVLRLAGGTSDAVALATQDDQSVAGGFFDVDVSEWDVRFG